MREHQVGLVHECAGALGLTVSEVLAIAATAPRRYFVWEIQKRSGGMRTVCHPARELKLIQGYFLRNVLHKLPVHAAATAYVKGTSIKLNAQIHRESRVILKLDFSDFFNSLTVSNWRAYAAVNFPSWTPDELEFSARILFWGNGVNRPKCLAIGAPTSPLLSNALMLEIDERISSYVQGSELIYTRYADDITLSSQGMINSNEAIEMVSKIIATSKFTNVQLNAAKTSLVTKKYCRRVTGLVLTPENKISVGRNRKRLISAMCHRHKLNSLPKEELTKLSGLLAFSLDIEPLFIKRLRKKYTVALIDGIMHHKDSSS